MPHPLAANSYGETRVRVVKIGRQPDRHALRELLVGVRFEGDFEGSFTHGDNAKILPTDTIKNTIYALAKLYSIEQIEEFAQTLIDHFLTDNRQIRSVTVDIAEQPWNRVTFGGKPHAFTFTPAGPEKHTVLVSGTREAASIEAGIQDLLLVKTAGAAFEGYRRDPFTTLPAGGAGFLATSLTARWLYAAGAEIPFGIYWHGAREAILETFIEHQSLSLQHTLYAVAEAVLERYADIVEIHLSLPSKEFNLVDLSKLGLENDNEVFAPREEPLAVIEARVRR